MENVFKKSEEILPIEFCLCYFPLTQDCNFSY